MRIQFRLAPMSPAILLMTLVALAAPVVFTALSLVTNRWFAVPAMCAAAIYTWIWVRFRPAIFVVDEAGIEVIWPLKRRTIPRESITSATLIDRREMRSKLGWGMRVGAGGVWGGFGWVWTTRRGIVQMYISRLDGFVWIETSARPWLITPEQPEEFVRAVTYNSAQ